MAFFHARAPETSPACEDLLEARTSLPRPVASAALSTCRKKGGAATDGDNGSNSRRILAGFSELTPGNEPGSELFAIKWSTRQMALEREGTFHPAGRESALSPPEKLWFCWSFLIIARQNTVHLFSDFGLLNASNQTNHANGFVNAMEIDLQKCR
jgi:hypothetical protein